MSESTITLDALSPEQMAALYAQFEAQKASEAAAKKVAAEQEKKAREARKAALTPHATPLAVAIKATVPAKETSASEKAREEAAAAGKPLPEAKFTRPFTTHVEIDGVKYTLFGYLSQSKDSKSA
jgi:membrane protein involved in colicin uptake